MASITLKWGTLKGWSVGDSPEAMTALKGYFEAGSVSGSVMAQQDNEAQKRALCALIDAVDEPIQNDWSGDEMTKADAKKYVMDYSRG